MASERVKTGKECHGQKGKTNKGGKKLEEMGFKPFLDF